jgi:hypothetical protein
MITLKRKDRTLSEKLADTIKDWRAPLTWLVLFIVIVVIVDHRHAPMIILFKLFRYLLLVFLLMFLPFVSGLAGFTRPIRTAWLVNVVVLLMLAGIYYAIYRQSIWRIWYQGPFDRRYLMGLLEAATIVPGISFIVGFVVRYWVK